MINIVDMFTDLVYTKFCIKLCNKIDKDIMLQYFTKVFTQLKEYKTICLIDTKNDLLNYAIANALEIFINKKIDKYFLKSLFADFENITTSGMLEIKNNLENYNND